MLPSEIKTAYIHHGDCIPFMATLPEASIDFSVFSPPFPSLYAYTSEVADIGNSEELKGEAKFHLSCFYRQLARIVKPGRVIVVHVAQIPRMKRNGEVGLHDFRGMNIRIAERAGLVFEYDWMVRKNPQAQAIRTRSRELQFSGLESDRAKSRGTLSDYLLKFRVPGINAVPIQDYDPMISDDDGDEEVRAALNHKEVSRNEWIQWAEASWSDIKETDTLNVRGTKGEHDTKHICPLQLGVIDRLVRLYTNPEELVFSPFAGIGSEGYQAILRGRRFLGCELKTEYHAKALENLELAVRTKKASEQLPLFA